MKFSDDMRFPHPVLTAETGDFLRGVFQLDASVEEIIETGKVSINYTITLDQPDIRALVISGVATVGIFVRCGDTYHASLREIGWPSGAVEFESGTLLNRVTVRPLIWLSQQLDGWEPTDVHEEFPIPLNLEIGDVLAIDQEQVLSVGQAKLAPMESIFALVSSPEEPEGKLSIKLDAEKISIIAGEQTYQTVNLLRFSPAKAAALTSIYLPAVMEVLDALRANPDAFENRRWKAPFVAKCTVANIDYNASLLESAQTLLEHPVTGLRKIAEGQL